MTEESVKKHLSWFMFDFHPMRFAKKLSEENQEDEEGTGALGGKE